MKETAFGPVFDNVLEGIGNTPMVKVSNIDTGPCELFLKLEANNPGGSIKDRIGVAMIEAAEKDNIENAISSRITAETDMNAHGQRIE